MAIASPTAPVECRFEDNQPRSGGMQEKAPDAATIKQP